MASLEGTWTPENEPEMQFVMGVNQLARAAYDEGVDPSDITGALGFMAASFAMHDDDAAEAPDADPGPLAAEDPDAKIEECPECGTEIDGVKTFIGGECIVDPCTCHVHYTRLGGWVENDGEEDTDGE